jgi:hypothetical protein
MCGGVSAAEPGPVWLPQGSVRLRSRGVMSAPRARVPRARATLRSFFLRAKPQGPNHENNPVLVGIGQQRQKGGNNLHDLALSGSDGLRVLLQGFCRLPLEASPGIDVIGRAQSVSQWWNPKSNDHLHPQGGTRPRPARHDGDHRDNNLKLGM